MTGVPDELLPDDLYRLIIKEIPRFDPKNEDSFGHRVSRQYIPQLTMGTDVYWQRRRTIGLHHSAVWSLKKSEWISRTIGDADTYALLDLYIDKLSHNLMVVFFQFGCPLSAIQWLMAHG